MCFLVAKCEEEERAQDLKRQPRPGILKNEKEADALTLAGRHRGVPGVIAVGGLLAHRCAFPNQLVASVAGPAHHAV